MRNVNRVSKTIAFSGLVAGLALIAGCGGAKIGGPFAAEYVYVATGSGVAEFAVTTTGQLTPLTPPEIVAAPTAFNTVWVSASKDGKYAYAANKNEGTISQFTIGATGALAAQTPATVTAGTAPVSVEVTPNNKYVYCLNQTDNTIQQFTAGSTGALTVMVPPTVPVAAGGTTLVISPNGNFVFACSTSSNTLTSYSVGATGQLSLVNTYTVTSPTGASLSPDGTHLYCPCSTGTAQFSVGIDGSLTPLAPAIVVQTGAGTGPNNFAVSTDGKHGYLSLFTGTAGPSQVDQYSIGLDGTLSALAPVSVTAGNNAVWVVTEPAGHYVFVSNQFDHTISEYTVAGNGTLIPETPAFVTPTGAHQMTIISR
jgi:6-phosphogluconolactonase